MSSFIDLLRLLATYPLLVRTMASLWIIFTAICIIIVVLDRKSASSLLEKIAPRQDFNFPLLSILRRSKYVAATWIFVTAIGVAMFIHVNHSGVSTSRQIEAIPEEPADSMTASRVEARLEPLTEAQPAELSKGTTDQWLYITRVTIHDSTLKGGRIRITANINGNNITYPSINGARWVLTEEATNVGPFRIQILDQFIISFKLIVMKTGGFEQVELGGRGAVSIDKGKLPYSSKYALYRLPTETEHSSRTTATLEFSISQDHIMK